MYDWLYCVTKSMDRSTKTDNKAHRVSKGTPKSSVSYKESVYMIHDSSLNDLLATVLYQAVSENMI